MALALTMAVCPYAVPSAPLTFAPPHTLRIPWSEPTMRITKITDPATMNFKQPLVEGYNAVLLAGGHGLNQTLREILIYLCIN